MGENHEKNMSGKQEIAMYDQWWSHWDKWVMTATSHTSDPAPYHTILPLRHSWQGWDMSDQWWSHWDKWGLTATSHTRDPPPYHTILPLRHSWQGWDLSDQWWSHRDKWGLTATSHSWPPTLPHNITSEAFLTGLRSVWSVMELLR